MRRTVGLSLAAGLLILTAVSCATPPPPGAVPGRIAVTADSASPFWNDLLRETVPERLNRRAGYPIANGAPGAPYRLSVRVLSADRFPVRMSPEQSGYGAPYGVTIAYRTRVEAEAELTGPGGESLRRWSAWAEEDTEAYAAYRLADDLAQRMRAAGFLAPGFYQSAAPVP